MAMEELDLPAEQAILVDKTLETKEDTELNTQLKVLMDEKQEILTQIAISRTRNSRLSKPPGGRRWGLAG